MAQATTVRLAVEPCADCRVLHCRLINGNSQSIFDLTYSQAKALMAGLYRDCQTLKEITNGNPRSETD